MLPEYFPLDDSAPLHQALERFSGASPKGGILALVAEADRERIPELMTFCRQRRIGLVGAVFPELVHGARQLKQGVILLPFANMPSCHLATIDPTLPAPETATALARGMEVPTDTDDQAVLCLFDSMVPNIASIVDALYLEWGDDVRYVGANAGSETFQPMPCLFDTDRIIGDGVLLVRLPGHPGACLEHGYTISQREATASSTTGNRITTIDWRPAFDVYQELAKEQFGAEIDSKNFYQFAVHYPIGIVKADGSVLVRVPVGLDTSDGSLICVGEVPANAMLTLMQAIQPGSSHTVDALGDCISRYQNATATVCFYCAGRRMHLQQATEAELQALQELCSPMPLLGALSLGEVGSSRVSRYPLFHNATIVTLPWTVT